MQEKEDDTNKKHPVDMTTDEAIDYVFGPEIADELRRQVADENDETDPTGSTND